MCINISFTLSFKKTEHFHSETGRPGRASAVAVRVRAVGTRSQAHLRGRPPRDRAPSRLRPARRGDTAPPVGSRVRTSSGPSPEPLLQVDSPGYGQKSSLTF